MKRIVLAVLSLALANVAVQAAEPVLGNWKTAHGETAKITACGGAYCITLVTGKFSGQQIGKMSGGGGEYSGEITDPANDKTYSGNASISGTSLNMQGCVLKVLCKSQTWTRM